MRIVIAGAGAVGTNLARELSADRHDITVVESDSELIQPLRERADVRALHGGATEREVLERADVPSCDVFVAVTNSDEVNIVACAMAHAMGAGRRIARIRNPSLSDKDALIQKREFHINRIVNPDELAAETAVRLIESPGVTFRAEFAEGEVLLRAFRLDEAAGIHGVPLHELAKRYPQRPFLIAAIERGGQVRIPRGNDVLRVDDIVYLLMLKGSEDEFRDLIRARAESVGRVVVYGASTIGIDLLRRLGRDAQRVLVEDRREAAEDAAARLEKVLVLHGWISDEEIRREVRFRDVDCFVAAGHDDRMNLVAALFAKQQGARRVLVVAREPDLVPLLRNLEFDAVINARLLAVSEISRFVRPGKVLSVQRIGEHGAEAVELIVRKGSKVAERALRELGLPDGAIVGAVFRDGTAFLPTGDTVLEVGDDIVAFVTGDVREGVERMFAGSKRILFEGGD